MEALYVESTDPFPWYSLSQILRIVLFSPKQGQEDQREQWGEHERIDKYFEYQAFVSDFTRSLEGAKDNTLVSGT